MPVRKLYDYLALQDHLAKGHSPVFVCLEPIEVWLLDGVLDKLKWWSNWYEGLDKIPLTAGHQDEMDAAIDVLRSKLMANCNEMFEQLVITNRMLVAALTGQAVNLDVPLQTTGTVSFTTTGLANRLGPETAHDGVNTIQYTLEQQQIALAQIQDRLAELVANAQAGNVNTNDMEEIMNSINVILGGAEILLG